MFKRWRFVKNIKISPKNWMALSEELKRQVLKVDDVDIYFQGNFIKTESAKEALYRYDTSLLPSVKSQTLSDAVLKDILTQMLLLAFPISMAQNEDFEQEVLPALTDTAPLTRFTQSICAEAFDSISVEQPVKLSTATAPTWRIDLKSEPLSPICYVASGPSTIQTLDMHLQRWTIEDEPSGWCTGCGTQLPSPEIWTGNKCGRISQIAKALYLPATFGCRRSSSWPSSTASRQIHGQV